MKYSLLIYIVVSGARATYEECKQPQVLLEKPAIKKEERMFNALEIYINKAIPEHISNAFTDVFLSISLKDKNSYKLYQAVNCSAVVDEYTQDNRLFGLLKSLNSWRATYLYPFNDTYIGVDTKEAYSVSTSTWTINYVRVALYIGGILLYLFAGSLVRNVIFYYTSGCSIGLLASVLLIAIIVYRVAPKKTIGIPILLGGWSFAAYVLHFGWTNFSFIIQKYQEYVIGYFVLALLISFAICYKRGPPTDDRSHDIAQWTLQILSLVIVYFSTQITKVSYATIAVLLLRQATKSWLWKSLKPLYYVLLWIWHRILPSSRRLLTQEEYERQAKETTERELAKLRDFYRSKDVDSWKLTHIVKNPKKLARFIDGSENHISDDEQIEHDIGGKLLDREWEDGINDEDSSYEIILRRRNRYGGPSSLNSPERSFLVPKGVSPDEILERISASARTDRKKTRIASKSRHSLGGPGLLMPSYRQESLPKKALITNQTSKRKKANAKSSRSSHLKDYYSSDSEDQTAYEEELLAQGDDFDFERD